jgi:glucokinase
MAKSIGVTLSEHVLAGLVVDHKLVGGLQRFPADEEERGTLLEMHTDALVATICDQITTAANGERERA